MDMGCGQGLLSAWLKADLLCQRKWCSWPQGWPPAPKPRSTRGIEPMIRDVERGRTALGPDCEISQGDIRSVEFGTTDAIVMLDVLHYIGREDQLQVLKRVRCALPARGLLLLRIGDADGSLRFCYSQWVDKLVMLFSLRPFGTHGRALSKRHPMAQPPMRVRLRGAGHADEPGYALRQCAIDRVRAVASTTS